jgi:hypothetical protein
MGLSVKKKNILTTPEGRNVEGDLHRSVFSKSKYANKQRRPTFYAFSLCGLYKEINILGYNLTRIIFWLRYAT